VVDEQPEQNEQPTQKQPAAGPDPAATEPTPASDPASAETTRFVPGSPPPGGTEGTAVLPPADQPDQPGRWSARAGVPARGPRVAAPEQQWVPEQQGSRVWWTPIVIGLAVLVLLGLVGLGLWLAVRGSTPAPGPSPTPGVSTTSATPSSAPPTNTSPPAVLVPVPPLANVPADQAADILRTQGLVAKLVNRVSDSLPAGTVIDTDPPAGTQVPVGSAVTLFVATPPATSASPTPTPDGSGTP
jgi:hypothetical protein